MPFVLLLFAARPVKRTLGAHVGARPWWTTWPRWTTWPHHWWWCCGNGCSPLSRERVQLAGPISPCVPAWHAPTGAAGGASSGRADNLTRSDGPYLSEFRQVSVGDSARLPVLLAAYTGGRTSGLKLSACKCNATPPLGGEHRVLNRISEVY